MVKNRIISLEVWKRKKNEN